MAYNNVFQFLFGYLDKGAVPAICLLPIIYVTLKVVFENILMISLCGLTAAIIS